MKKDILDTIILIENNSEGVVYFFVGVVNFLWKAGTKTTSLRMLEKDLCFTLLAWKINKYLVIIL